MTSESKGMECRDKCLCNAYLLHVLQKRSTELKTAYQHIVQFDCRTHTEKADAFAQTRLETDDVAIQTLHSFTADCDDCHTLRETAQSVKQQLSSSLQSVTERDRDLEELKKQLAESANLVSELRARADAEEAARKVKEEQVEELEELVMVCKSESLVTEQQQHSVVENSARENEFLKTELNALEARLQTKEEALAQNMFEKDDLEDVNGRLQTTNASLLNQLDELRLQLKNQNSQFETEVQQLADEKQQLMEKVQNLSAELTRCQQSASVAFSCSQPVDLLASQQSCELSSVKLELLTVQAEKDDLIEQLHQCKNELSVVQSSSCRANQSVQSDSKKTMQVAVIPQSAGSSREELESQNAALLGQLLVLEDQLSESEVLLQESRESRQQSEEQHRSALKDLSDISARIAGLEQEKSGLETELSTARTSLETSEARLQECRTQLSLVEGKLSSAGNRQRQLMYQKQLLESQNCELLRKLQVTGAASSQQVISVQSHTAGVGNLEHVRSSVAVKENKLPPASKLSVTTEPFQRSGNQHLTQSVVGTSEYLGPIITTSFCMRPRSRRQREEMCGVCSLTIRLGVWGSIISSPSRVRGSAPADNGFYAYLSSERSHLEHLFQYF